MFTFINLSILTALLAVSLPLLIHLFNRHRKKKVSFSSVRFLKLLEKQRLKRLKLYEYLLIIIRTVIILMLVLAFARPTLTTKSVFSSQGARTTAVILLDTGINMRRYDDSGNRFLRALEKVAQVKQNFKPEDQVYLISSIDPDHVLNSIGEIQEQQASFQGGSWDSAFQTSRKLFEDHPNFNQELYIVSDFQFQQNNFQKNLQLFSNAHIYFVKIGELPVPNISIDTVDIKSQILELNKPINLDVFLKSTRFEEAHPVEIHMFVNDKRVSHRRVLIDPNQTEIVPMSFLPQNSGFSNGYIEISDDDLLADNRYYFVVNIPTEINILFVDDNPSPYLLAAMQSLSTHTNISLNINKYNSWAGQSFQKYDVIWLSNIPKLSAQIQNRLKIYSESGGSLILMPGLNTVPSEFNSLAKKLAFSIQLIKIIQTDSPKEFYTFASPDLDHSLFRGLFRTVEPDIEDPRFYRYFKTIIPKEMKRIFSFQNGDPFLIQIDINEGRSFYFSSYIEDEWTDFQFRGLFLPLLSRLMYFAISSSTQADLSSKVGTPKFITTKNHQSNKKFYLYDNDGNKSTIVPKIVDQTYQFKLSNLNKPGLYRIKTDNQLLSVIPVNCETKIYDEPYLDFESVLDEVPQTVLFNEDQKILEVVNEARFGIELWKLFILFSLLFIFAELFFIKSMEGKQRR